MLRWKHGRQKEDQSRLKKQRDRNLDLYTEGEIDMTALKDRQEKLRGRTASLEREKDAIQKSLSYADTDLASLSKFCETISRRLDDVSFAEKRQILHLLNVEGSVKGGTISLTGCVSDAGDCAYPASEFASLRLDMTGLCHHSSGAPGEGATWIPAFAGMTFRVRFVIPDLIGDPRL